MLDHKAIVLSIQSHCKLQRNPLRQSGFGQSLFLISCFSHRLVLEELGENSKKYAMTIFQSLCYNARAEFHPKRVQSELTSE